MQLLIVLYAYNNIPPAGQVSAMGIEPIKNSFIATMHHLLKIVLSNLEQLMLQSMWL